MSSITIKGLNIGAGAPKIIVPLVSKTEQEIYLRYLCLERIDYEKYQL